MHSPSNALLRGLLLALAMSVGSLVQGASGDEADASASPEATEEKSEAASADVESADPNRITREGVVVEFSTRPTHGTSDKVIAADWADVTFRITDGSTGEPIKGRYPAAWMDLAEAWRGPNSRHWIE